MPAAVISIGSLVSGEFAVLSIAPPGAPRVPLGILLLDSKSGKLNWKLRQDIEQLPLPPEDQEYVSYLDSDFQARVEETSGAEFFEWMENTLSGFLQISDRETVSGRNTQRMLDRLFQAHVQDKVRPFETHLPYYQLRAAATRFSAEHEVSESDVEWLRAPEGLRLTDDMFVVQVVGRSMEPLIPDGSLAVFRKFGAGSRKGKRLLIQELGALDSAAQFTVKRYTSTYKNTGDEWAHETIRLEPLNPEFPAFELDAEAFAGRYRVIAEFVQVLDTEE